MHLFRGYGRRGRDHPLRADGGPRPDGRPDAWWSGRSTRRPPRRPRDPGRPRGPAQPTGRASRDRRRRRLRGPLLGARQPSADGDALGRHHPGRDLRHVVRPAGDGAHPDLPHHPDRELRLRRDGRHARIADRGPLRGQGVELLAGDPRRPRRGGGVGRRHRPPGDPPLRSLVAARPHRRHDRAGADPGRHRPRDRRRPRHRRPHRQHRDAAERQLLRAPLPRPRRPPPHARSGPGRPRPRWAGSCCAPTPAAPCGPPPRTRIERSSSACRCAGSRRSCGRSPELCPRPPSSRRHRSPAWCPTRWWAPPPSCPGSPWP